MRAKRNGLGMDELPRKLLPHTYYAFFAHFRHLSEIQRQAVEPIVNGQDVLLMAATATGKTQAYCAPLMQRYYESLKKGEAAVLILSPTRALVNDLYRRLKNTLEACAIPLYRKTGDHRLENPEQLSGVCLTTPESLDSWLARHARALVGVRAIVLDELHVLTGTARGSQLQLLLQRLETVTRALSQPRPQRVAASATVSDPQALARDYLGEGAQILIDPRRRPLEIELAQFSQPDELWARLRDEMNAGRRKFLIFCPTRREVEEIAELLKRASGRSALILVHHGALSKSTRLRNESSFLRLAQGILISTSSLELGLDIGDVDGVVLMGPPPDVSSFLQRAGRSGRRQGPGFLLAVHRSEAERLQLEHLADAAARGDLLGQPPAFFASVLFQQAASLTFQNRGGFISARAWHARLPASLQQRFTESTLDEMLQHWEKQGFYVMQGERFLPSQRLEQMHTRGKTHSNIEDSAGTREVIEAETGRSLGHVRVGKEDESFAQGGRLVMGGQRRRFLSLHGDGPLRTTVESGAQAGGEARALAFAGSNSSPTTSRPLAEDLGRFLGLDAGMLEAFPSHGQTVIAHFWGSVWGELLCDFFRYTLRKERRQRSFDVKADGYLLYCNWAIPPDLFEQCQQRWREQPPEWNKLLHKRLGKLGRVSQSGPWFSRLPTQAQWEDLAVRLELDAFARRVLESRLRSASAVRKKSLLPFVQLETK